MATNKDNESRECGVIYWPYEAESKSMFDLPTLAEVEAMHDSVTLGGLPKDEWLRRSRMPMRALLADDVPVESWSESCVGLYVREGGDLFRLNIQTGRIQSGHGVLNDIGISWDGA